MIALGLLWLAAVWLTILYGVGNLAERYGRHSIRWIALALIVGVFAYLPLLGAGPVED